MEIINCFNKKKNDPMGCRPVTLAFTGDSVTQGSYELAFKRSGGFDTLYDPENVYHVYLRHILALVFPMVPVNIINAGVAGDSVEGALSRLERDVLSYRPDLTVCCFGLNNCGRGTEGLDDYANTLGNMFDRLKDEGSEVIYLSPNAMNNDINPYETRQPMLDIANSIMQTQLSGDLKMYVEKSKQVAADKNIPVCDCFSVWDKMDSYGIGLSSLLANQVNHPVKEMHWLFAWKLFETMLG